jgi:formate hydrogenlyase subunit 3/multisubunit Na+/H+ antiporter MnhD subunit
MNALPLLFAAFGAIALGFVVSAVVRGALGRAAGFAGVLAGGACALASGVGVLLRGASVTWAGPPAAHLALRVDPLAGAFVAIVGAVGIVVGIYALGGRTGDERGDGRAAACAACGVLFASLAICAADDVLLFVFAWELLALAFYQAISYAGSDPRGPAAGYLTIVLTHVGAAGLLAAFLLIGHGSFGLHAALADGGGSSVALRNLAFVLFLCAFGSKIGLLPFPIWLARGYTAAPSVVAALMAGGALNVGFYGLARVGFTLGGAVPVWWGLVLIVCGALAAFFGIAWAAAQDDMRTLAAYSSVENAGIVVVGLGVALVGRALDLPLLAGIGLAAALVHATAHAFAKCTLFLGCAELASSVGTTTFAALGGLWRRFPASTVTVLAAAASLAALPPTGGFAGEWMTLEALLQAFRTGHVVTTIVFALAGAAIGIAAGIAVVAFVKLVGIGFLGAARSPAAEQARPARRPLRAAGLILAAGSAGVRRATAPLDRRLRRCACDRGDPRRTAADPAGVRRFLFRVAAWARAGRRGVRGRVRGFGRADSPAGVSPRPGLDLRRTLSPVDAIHGNGLRQPDARDPRRRRPRTARRRRRGGDRRSRAARHVRQRGTRFVRCGLLARCRVRLPARGGGRSRDPIGRDRGISLVHPRVHHRSADRVPRDQALVGGPYVLPRHRRLGWKRQLRPRRRRCGGGRAPVQGPPRDRRDRPACPARRSRRKRAPRRVGGAARARRARSPRASRSRGRGRISASRK